MKFLPIRLLSLLILCSILGAKHTDAQTIEAPIIKALDGSYRYLGGSLVNQIKKDSSVMNEDDKWWIPAEKAKLDLTGGYRIKNIISLKLNEDSNALLKPKFTVTVRVRLFITRSDGVLDSTQTPFLSITYDTATGAKYNNQSVLTFYNAYRVRVKILGVDSTYVPTNVSPKPAVTPFVRLENEMQITREYNYTCNAASATALTLTTNTIATNGEALVGWPLIQGATEYDLEWAYIDNESLLDPELYKTAGNLDAKKIFLNNSTRITVASTQYSIPIIYDEAGTVFVRYRPVQNKPNGQRYEGNWSSDNSAGLGQILTNTGHEPALNWQVTTSFAEDGKRKSVVQYADGSLRARQTVTKDNSTNTTVVAESLYDYQGRPTIQVLPAPTISGLIQYSKNFNRGLNGAYDKALYDTLVDVSDYCLGAAPAMATDSGAAKYYSPNNPLANVDHNKFIPNANGYAFTETRYSQDNTGRVLAQSGVGENYKIGSGRETRYFYGNPSQYELDGLFGTEVGYASHYQKNMVRDANGQYSVSYIDMHGRTIATALAGKNPAALDTVPSYNKKIVTEKLADSSNNLVKDMVMESSRSILVPDSGAYTFTYSLNPDSLRVATCANTTICYDCLYNLQISITDECNNCHLPNREPYVVVDSNFSFANIDTLCNTPVGFNRAFTIGLPEGNYTITKKLSVSKYAFEYYRDSVFMKKNTCKTFQDFYKEVSDTIRSQMDCSPPNCDSCTAKTGSIVTFRINYLNTAGIPLADSVEYRDEIATAYAEALEECKEICENNSQNDLIRKVMLLDVTAPSGQYANPDSANLARGQGNIFRTTNANTTPVWQYSNIIYHDEYGNPDLIMNSAGTLVAPNHTSITQAEFIANFKESWAKDLLPYHPEYSKLLEYEKHIPSHLWDEKFGQVETYSEANSKGYLNPVALTGSQLPSHFSTIAAGYDPLAKPDSLLNGIMQTAVYNFKNDNNHFFSMWGVASVSGKCPDDNNCAVNYKNTVINNCINSSTFCDGELDMSWRSFRQIYLTDKRRKLMQKLHTSFPYVRLSIPQYRIEHFAESDAAIDLYMTEVSTQSSGTILAGSQAQMQAFYQNNCENYAADWWTKLAPCNLTTADSLSLIPRMVQICVAGSDATHTFGSSSTAPASTLPYKSFEALIKHYIDSMHTINPTQYNYDISCNADAIYMPMPYDKQQAMGTVVLWTKPDSCQCDQITTQYNQYINSGAVDSSFSAYLYRTSGTVIKDITLSKLRNLCNGVDTCKFMVSPIYLPPVLQCGIKDICVTCVQVQNTFDSFKVVYPGVLPAFDESDSLQALKNRAFANYMNNHIGFSKTAADYLTFMSNCPVGYDTISVRCDSLKLLLKNYQQQQYNAHTPIYDDGCDVSRIKINNGGWTHDPAFNFNEWMQNGSFQMPEKDTSISGGGISTQFNYTDTLCLDNYFVFESRVKFPIKPHHLQHYVNKGGGAYRYGSHFQEFHFNNLDVYILILRGTWLHPQAIDSIYGYVWIKENGVYTQQYSNISTGLKTLHTWANIKLDIRNGVGNAYLNGQLLHQFTYVNAFNQFNAYATDPYGYDFAIDHIKMYDTTGKLRYFEDFTGCGSMGKQTLPRCNTSCPQGFVNYYNTQQNTNYTFNQIDSVYFATCGIHPQPCTDDPSNCGDLKQALVEYYKTTTPHDTTGTQTAIWSLHSTVPRFTPPSGYRVNDFIQNGMYSTPDSITVNPADFYLQYNVPICLGNAFSFETAVKDKGDIIDRTVDGSPVLNFKFNNGDSLTIKFKIHEALLEPDSLLVFVNGNKKYANTTILTINPGSWTKIKATFANGKLFIYTADVLRATINYPNTFTSLTNYNIGGWRSIAVKYDYVKFYNAQGSLKLVDEFEDYTNFTRPPYEWVCTQLTCETGFTPFFNARYATNYTYPQIRTIYQQKCGMYLQPCGNNGGGGGTGNYLLCGKTEPIFPILTDTTFDPCADTTSMIFVKATEKYTAYLDSLKNAFDNAYLQKCMQAFKTESFVVTHPQSEYHYTLYYYDQAGNLVKTVPPAGVDGANQYNTTWLNNVAIARKAGTVQTPAHGLQTNYRYNSLNQVVASTTPDAGLSTFFYDRLGRLVISQNAKQKANSATENNRHYSYTKYDVLGRIAEVGQLRNATTTALTQATAQNVTAFNTWFTSATATNANIEMVTRTVYDNKYAANVGLPILYPKNLRNRVAYTTYTIGNSIANYNAATFYSYDIHGNVDTLLQDYGQSITGLTNIMNSNASRWKRMVYKYDLISGKVNWVGYQPNYFNGTTLVTSQDALYHRYSYDAENRLTQAETSTDSTVWQKDARYTYYKHGPLARTVLGNRQVQGLDYAYTLQGWLKGMNSSVLSPSGGAGGGFDMGRDGDPTNPATKNICRDALGFNLNYYIGDYAAISGSNTFAGIGTLPIADIRQLYNGNITSMAVNIGRFNSTAGAAGDSALLYNYKYDQLNRIVAMDAFRGLNTTTNTWNNSLTNLQQYKERIAYDANGNILKYLRHGNKTATPIMDSMSYKYTAGTNRLDWVKDNVTAATYTDDIDNNQAVGNYTYDAIGNLTRDSSENIRLSVGGIKWNVYGKITEINKVDSTAATPYNKGRIKKITYTYDAAGNRISKKVEKYGTTPVSYTWYVRDASGNVMSTYTYTSTTATDLTASNLIQNDVYLYGSSRLGSLTVNRDVEVTKQTTDTTYTSPLGLGTALKVPFVTGQRQYEIANHLGNIYATISDKKIPVSAGGVTIDYYKPDVLTATDYAPFGLILSGRNYNAPNAKDYTYGFNGNLNDNEAKGEGNMVDFGARVYDVRLGRFFATDKYMNERFFYTPYSFAANKPILAIDYKGNVDVIVTIHKKDKNGVLTTVTNTLTIETIEDIRGITRKPYKIDIFQTEVLMTSPWLNGTTSWYGWQTDKVTQDGQTGKTPEQANYDPVGAYAGKAILKFWPIAKAVDAFEQRSPITGEYYHPARKYFQTAEAILDAVTLGRGVVARKALTPIIDYLKSKGKDFLVEETIKLAAEKISFFKDKDKLGILLYHIIKFSSDVKKGKIDDLYKLLNKLSSLANKGGDAQIKSELMKVGVNMDLLKNGQEAVNKVVKEQAGDPSKIEVINK